MEKVVYYRGQKTFRMNKKLVEREFQWFSLSYGLRDANPIR